MSTAMRRSRPALGTLVEIRAEGLREADVLRALEAAFAQVSAVHRLMSFHTPDSDLAKLHRAVPGTAVRVDPRTFAVIGIAQDIAAASNGVFDVSVAASLVQLGLLPRPASPYEPDPQANWRDIELLAGERVRFARPLWIDLGGIAKGYAVDRAIDVLRTHGATHAAVNAGGDLRLFGARTEPVFLRIGSGIVPALELADAAIATSARDIQGDAAARPHLHGATRIPVGGDTCVSVIAAHCVIADALTKVVLAADPAMSTQLLARYAAEASVHDPAHGWSRLSSAYRSRAA